VASYDENALASARAYAPASPGSLWSLERASAEWTEAVTMAPPELTMTHPVRGEISLDDMIVANAHDAAHHVFRTSGDRSAGSPAEASTSVVASSPRPRDDSPHATASWLVRRTSTGEPR